MPYCSPGVVEKSLKASNERLYWKLSRKEIPAPVQPPLTRLSPPFLSLPRQPLQAPPAQMGGSSPVIDKGLTSPVSYHYQAPLQQKDYVSQQAARYGGQTRPTPEPTVAANQPRPPTNTTLPHALQQSPPPPLPGLRMCDSPHHACLIALGHAAALRTLTPADPSEDGRKWGHLA